MGPAGWVVPKAVWLPAVKNNGLEISRTFTHRQGHTYVKMNFTNNAVQHMTDFVIQLNKRSFGVIPSTPLADHTPQMPKQRADVSLPLNTLGSFSFRLRKCPLNTDSFQQTAKQQCLLPRQEECGRGGHAVSILEAQ